MTVVSWNVLAAPWVHPSFYPAEMDPQLLDRGARADLTGSMLASFGADVMCLQETTPPDLARMLEKGFEAYEAYAAPNGPELWSNWSTPDVPWEPNGTAIVWRSAAFTDVETGEVMISDDGNVATTFGARHVESGVAIRVMSVHLDADDPARRLVQFPVALAAFGAATSGSAAGIHRGIERGIDIVAGDCNEDIVGTELGRIVTSHGFRDALGDIGNFDPTHPYARPSDDFASVGRIDHILVRGAVPHQGRVLDSDVWNIEIPGKRLDEHLARTGSDHLPVIVTVGCT